MRRCGSIGGSSRSLSQRVHFDTVIVLQKQLVNRTEPGSLVQPLQLYV